MASIIQTPTIWYKANDQLSRPGKTTCQFKANGTIEQNTQNENKANLVIYFDGFFQDGNRLSTTFVLPAGMHLQGKLSDLFPLVEQNINTTVSGAFLKIKTNGEVYWVAETTFNSMPAGIFNTAISYLYKGSLPLPLEGFMVKMTSDGYSRNTGIESQVANTARILFNTGNPNSGKSRCYCLLTNDAKVIANLYAGNGSENIASIRLSYDGRYEDGTTLTQGIKPRPGEYLQGQTNIPPLSETIITRTDFDIKIKTNGEIYWVIKKDFSSGNTAIGVSSFNQTTTYPVFNGYYYLKNNS